jgi:hypothetical protein
MKMDFADTMRAATELTRAQKMMEATRVIQSALLLGRGPTEAEDQQAVEVRAIERLTIDIVPNVAPTVTLPVGDIAATLVRRDSQPSGSMAWRASDRASLSRSPRALST